MTLVFVILWLSGFLGLKSMSYMPDIGLGVQWTPRSTLSYLLSAWLFHIGDVWGYVLKCLLYGRSLC